MSKLELERVAKMLTEQAAAKMKRLEGEIALGKERESALEQDLAEACRRAEAYQAKALERKQLEAETMLGGANLAPKVRLCLGVTALSARLDHDVTAAFPQECFQNEPETDTVRKQLREVGCMTKLDSRCTQWCFATVCPVVQHAAGC
jgi:hypothetical protein